MQSVPEENANLTSKRWENMKQIVFDSKFYLCTANTLEDYFA